MHVALPPLEGLLICGGRSVRMGRDKALLRIDGRTLIEHGLACLDAVAAPVRLACGSRERYGEYGRPLVLDAFEDGGPLAGLLAGLEGAGAERIAVLAVDMPGASPDLFRALHERALSAELDVALLSGARGDEPLCSIVHRRCAPSVRRALESGERRMIGFHASAAGGALRVERFAPAELVPAAQACDPTHNVNTPADWRAWTERTRCAESRR
jgi:molybdopterin-guanine dinucleotide biosynthesis protein A